MCCELLAYISNHSEKIVEEQIGIIGKPRRQAWKEVEDALDKGQVMVDVAEEALGETVVYQSPDGSVVKRQQYDPVGVVLGLLPWEQPVFESVTMAVAAILGGNSLILKDHPDAPVFSKFLEQALDVEAPGLVQRCFLETTDVQRLLEENQIQYLCFSGRYGTGLEVYHELGRNNFIDFSLDIGGFN